MQSLSEEAGDSVDGAVSVELGSVVKLKGETGVVTANTGFGQVVLALRAGQQERAYKLVFESWNGRGYHLAKGKTGLRSSSGSWKEALDPAGSVGTRMHSGEGT